MKTLTAIATIYAIAAFVELVRRWLDRRDFAAEDYEEWARFEP